MSATLQGLGSGVWDGYCSARRHTSWGNHTTGPVGVLHHSEVGARKHDWVLLVCNQDMNRLIEWALLPSRL